MPATVFKDKENVALTTVTKEVSECYNYLGVLKRFLMPVYRSIAKLATLSDSVRILINPS